MVEHYELLAIFPGTQTDEEVQVTVTKLQEALTSQGAVVTKHEFWGKRKLAYEIKHIRHGYYDLTEFDIDTQSLQKIDSALRLNDTILRHQIVVRVVKTPEQIAAETALHERIAAKRQALREKEQVASAVADAAPAPEVSEPAAPSGPLEKERLDKKLEELLESDKVDI